MDIFFKYLNLTNITCKISDGSNLIQLDSVFIYSTNDFVTGTVIYNKNKILFNETFYNLYTSNI